MKSPLYFKKLAWRDARNEPKCAITISGPRRDFDHAVFCGEHNTEAEEFAAEWTAELIDALDPGEDASVKIEVRHWSDAIDHCCVCDEDEEPKEKNDDK